MYKYLMLVSLLTSCATPYQPEGLRGGYSDVSVGSNKYLVSFRGNGYTGPTTVYQYALQRAKELCNEKGFTDFQILDKESVSQDYQYNGGTSCSGNVYGNSYTANCHSNTYNTTKHGNSLLITCTGSNDQPAVAPAH